MRDGTFRTKCMCGCGDGIEMVAEKGHIRVSFFRDDTGARASILKERAEYAAGKNLLREIMMDRDTFLAMLSFLEDADLEDTDRGGANRSHLAPTHLLDDIYAVWLQGTLPLKAVFGDWFRKMFGLSLTAMDRDVLVVQMKGWLARERTHAIPEGASPHVDRLAGTSAPVRKAPTKEDVAGMASTALRSVKAAAKAAMSAARHTADPEGAAMEDALEAEAGLSLSRGPSKESLRAGAMAAEGGGAPDEGPDDDVLEDGEPAPDDVPDASDGRAAGFMAGFMTGPGDGESRVDGGDDEIPRLDPEEDEGR